MKPEGLNNRAEVIDMRLNVMFAQTENGTYCVYYPDNAVIYGKNCYDLAQMIFNEKVISELSEVIEVHAVTVLAGRRMKEDQKVHIIDFKNDLWYVKYEDNYYVVDTKQVKFYSSDQKEITQAIIRNGLLEVKSAPIDPLLHSNSIEQIDMSMVVHCKKEKFDVYIGRPSKWGNPFVIGKDGDRDKVIRKYEQYLLDNKDLMNSLHELRGKTLGCWCSPEPCHGHVILKHVNRLFLTEKMQDDMGNTVTMQKGPGGQAFSLVDSFGNTRNYTDIYSVMEGFRSKRLEHDRCLIKGEDAFESKEIQDEMGLYKGRKLSI